MKTALVVLLLFAATLPSVSSYGATITVNSTASASISNFYQDLAYCSCDLTPSLCDNYCCCDASCSAVSSYICRVFKTPGLLHRAACLHQSQFKAFATRLQFLGLDLSAICHVFIFLIEEQSEITTVILKLHL